MDTEAVSPPQPAGAGTVPPMTFSVPEGLHAIPLPLDQAERNSSVASLVREMYPEGDSDLWNAMQAVYGPIADDLVEMGVAFTGIGLYDIGDDQVGHCSLTVGAMECDQQSPEVTALGVRELFGRRPMHEVSWLDLSCGPAVSVITTLKTFIDGGFTSSGEDVEVISGQIQVYVPFPADPYIAVFTMETMAEEHFEEFGVMLSTIVASIAFPDENTVNAQS
jgi:hypothetical protein